MTENRRKTELPQPTMVTAFKSHPLPSGQTLTAEEEKLLSISLLF